MSESPLSEQDELWYKDAIIYEVHVRAFRDTSQDGMGDFRGLTEKLGYLQDLGVTAIWLLPFFPSPWKDDGYDISDYTDVHPAYGTLRDFEVFLREAHRRGLRVITEMVLNHTSDQHPWFQRARRADPGSRWRDFYVWSDTPEKYSEARIIFKDFEASNWTWDPIAKAYYWHRFYSHQPDLNYDNPAVRRAVLDAVDFWFDLGVDGLRLDAVPYLFEREGTNCENLPETHAFLKELRRHVDSKYKGRLLLAEANQWPEDAIAYFGDGDECHMAFHFPLMPRMFMAHRMEDRFPIVDILERTPSIPENCQWALFLRNHDELTLEMVTDEERDYMYRSYARESHMRINLGIRRRLAPLLNNDRRRIELMNALLFSMPGSPVIYYGDEIGMGDNVFLGDRNGVRTPMQWSPDRNAGFSAANPQRLYLPVIIDPEYHYEAVNVEAQQQNPSSLLWWMKHLIALRKNSKALSRGSLEFLHPENRRVLAFLRRHEDERILMVVNLSRFPQSVSLDLSRFKGTTPIEMLGHSEFPPITEAPYLVMLGPYGYYWFLLPEARREETAAARAARGKLPELVVGSWQQTFQDVRVRTEFARILPPYLRQRPWVPARTRRLRTVDIVDALPIPGSNSHIVIIRAHFGEGDPEMYLVPVSIARGEQALRLLDELTDTVMTRVRGPGNEEGIIYRALWDKDFRRGLIEAVARRRRIKGLAGELLGIPTRSFRQLVEDAQLEPTLQKTKNGNASILYDELLILKLFRKAEEGINPELEIGRFLTEKARFPHVPALVGWLEYRPRHGEPMTLGVIHAVVANQGEAWDYTIDSLALFYELALAKDPGEQQPPSVTGSPLELLDQPVPREAEELIGIYLENARLLGQRTAEMHLALSGSTADPNFAPESFNELYRKALYHGMVGLANRTFDLLHRKLRSLPPDAQPEAVRVLQLEAAVHQRFRPIRDQRVSGVRIRHHGDYHLKQVLFTGMDFAIIDFEGERARPLSERRIKRSALRDVASMLRSFHYAAFAVLFGQMPGIIESPEKRPILEGWARFWHAWVSRAFLEGYLTTAGNAPFLPATREELQLLLDAYTLEKAIDELGFELNDRPDWVRIPLLGILEMLERR